jgi:hypothetical protein
MKSVDNDMGKVEHDMGNFQSLSYFVDLRSKLSKDVNLDYWMNFQRLRYFVDLG